MDISQFYIWVRRQIWWLLHLIWTSSSVSSSNMPKYEFSYVPGFFVDYAGLAKQSPNSQLGTQPCLGLLNRQYETEDSKPRGNGISQSDDAPVPGSDEVGSPQGHGASANHAVHASDDMPQGNGVLESGGTDSSVPESSVPQWEKFANHVKWLNRNSPEGESYKVMFVLRHGLGVHNVAMSKYGGQAWKDHWSHLDGDGSVVWVDAHLVETGIEQAKHLGETWLDMSRKDGMPLPQTLYTSPLSRCLHTTKLAYTPVMADHGQRFQPVVKELLRERLTDHTCDKRHPRSWIRDNYPDYAIEKGFEEEDMLWRADRTETEPEHIARKQRLLEDIFESDDSDFISLSTHSYAVIAILGCLNGAPRFRVSEGTMIALFVKAVRTVE